MEESVIWSPKTSNESTDLNEDSWSDEEGDRDKQEKVETADWLRKTSAKVRRIVSSRLNRVKGDLIK